MDKLMAQISVYAGRYDGGLATLQDYVHKMETGQKIICQACNQEIKKSHAHNCPIVLAYLRLFDQR